MITIEPATRTHAIDMAPRLRADDLAEVVASGFKTPLDGLLESLELSECAFTVLIDGKPASMMGVVVPDIIGRSAMPWLLTTDIVESYPLQHTRDARRVVQMLAEEYGALETYVDARYTRTLRWLRSMGFEIHEPRPIPPTGALFCPVTRRS